ncbi:GTPase IMAP family member 7-like [Gadus morhua]|nr:GTPase IMAP family member 7-like [Gadus morhua]
MGCDCLADSVCTATSTSCQDWITYIDVFFPDLQLLGSGFTAVLAVSGFSFYMLTHGMLSLWSGVSFIVGTLRGIFKVVTWSSKLWRFFTGVNKGHSSSSTISGSLSLNDPGLRLLLVGPSGAGRTQLVDAFLGCTEDRAPWSSPSGALTESVRRRALVDGQEVTVVDTPDLLGQRGDGWKAREALRSLQLSTPGPHAVLLVIRVPGAAGCVDQDAALAVRATLALFGAGVAGHVFTVFTHADSLAPGQTLATLLGGDAGGLRAALSVCGLRAELVDNGAHCPPEDRRRMCMRLLERLEEMRALSGHFVHELHVREERMKEELLADMSSELAGKLGSM